MPTTRLPFLVRVGALLGPDAAGVRQSLVALGVGLVASLVAGLTLGAITGTLEALPGLLVLVPAAVGLRGAIFGALGSRLGTAIHMGTFRVSARADTVLGQNVLAAAALTLSASVVLAFLAKAVAAGFGLGATISVADFVVISAVGGVLSSVVVLVLTVALAAGSVRFGWDLDNVTAPVVTAAADMVTLPSLFVATALAGRGVVTLVLALLTAAAGAAALVAGLRSTLAELVRILRESLPVLVFAGLLSLLAGLTLEQRLDALVEFPALLVLVPPFLASAGAAGGILSSRLGSKLHLGTLTPTTIPGRAVRADVGLAYGLAVPSFAAAALLADLAAGLVGLRSPGVLAMVTVALLGGLLATSFAVAAAYYAAVAAYRFGLDPDNLGIPLVTSSLDLVGALSFLLAVALLGYS